MLKEPWVQTTTPQRIRVILKALFKDDVDALAEQLGASRTVVLHWRNGHRIPAEKYQKALESLEGDALKAYHRKKAKKGF